MTNILPGQVVDIDSLKPWPTNYNQHDDDQRIALGNSLEQFGQFKNIVIANRNGSQYIVAGHGLVESAKERGIAELDAKVVPDDWTDEKIEALLVADNRLAQLADPDEEALADLLQSIRLNDDSLLDGIGYDSDAIDEMLKSIGGAGEPGKDTDPQVNRADELRDEWGTELGQLWQLGPHRLICGDCTDSAVVDRLMNGEMADMVFTDPPYGVGYTGGHFHSGDVNIKRERETLQGDNDSGIYRQFIPTILPFVDGPFYVWFASSVGKPLYDAIQENKCESHAMIVWHKTNATYAAMNAQYKQRHEPCMYFKPKGSNLRWVGPTDECTIWEIKRDPVNELHPTQKPIDLAERALGNHKAETVLDVFAGSGSTLIAAHNLDRICYACEISPAYCAVILQRFADHTDIQPELIDD